MADPSDDEMSTIGLPRNVVKQIIEGSSAAPPRHAARPATDPRAAGPPPVPPRPSARPVSPPESDPISPGEIRLDDLATMPPPSARRSSTSPIGSGPAQDDRRHPRLEPRSQQEVPHSGKTPARSLEPSLPLERPLDDMTGELNLPPRPGHRPGPGPLRDLRPGSERSPEIARPLPAETFAAPSALFTPPLPEPLESHSDTPIDSPPPAAIARRAPLERRTEPAEAIEHTQNCFSGIRASSAGKSIVQFFDKSIGEWLYLGEVGRAGKVVGRATFQASDTITDGLPEEHLQFVIVGDELILEPLESLNGVYRRLQPGHREAVTPHTRFRIGRHVLELRHAEPASPIVPLRAGDGEVFQSRVLVPLGFLDLIGPDARPYLSFPLTKRDERGTRIGRAGAECDIALSGDEWVSQRHARLIATDGPFWLEDLESKNGTYLIVNGRTPIRRGTARSPGAGDEILIGPYKIRVVER